VAEAKGIVLPDQPDFSLAEIYCVRAKAERLGQPQKIGFA
jgi:hypothetical protein